VSSLLEGDFVTLRSVTIPDERDSIDAAEDAAKLADAPPVEDVTVNARLAKQAGDTATLDFSGSYCVPEQSHEVTVTTLVSSGESESDGSSVPPETDRTIVEPRHCFELEEVFDTTGIEYQRVDGKWFGPLPTSAR